MKLLKPFVLLLLCFGYFVAAQEEPLASPGVLSRGEVLVATTDYPQDHLRNITQLWSLDLFDGAPPELYLNLEREGYRVHDIEIAQGGEYLFTLEIAGREDTGFVPLGESQLIRMNLQTGEREVMFTGVNLVNFSLSPNAEQALIRFYPEDMTFVDRYDLLLREQWCVVTLHSNQSVCRNLIFARETYPRAFEWVSNYVLAYILNHPDSIYLFDSTTFTKEVIALPDGNYANEIRNIPDTDDQLLVYDAPFTADEVGKLLLLDLNRKSFREIAEIPISTGIVEVSPNGDHAVMAGGYPPQAILIDLQSGSVIQSFPTIYDMQWTSFQWLPIDHTLFLIGNLGFRGRNVLTVVFEPFTNSTTNIIDDVGGTLIVVG